MSQIYTAYFYIDVDQCPSLIQLLEVIESYNFSYLGSGYSLTLEAGQLQENDNIDPVWSIDDLRRLKEDAIFINQMWEGKEESSFSINFLKYTTGWICVFQCSDHDFDRIRRHFKGTNKNLIDLFVDIYLVLSAKNLIVVNELNLQISQYLKFIDYNFALTDEIPKLISAAIGLSEQCNKIIIDQGFELAKVKGIDFMYNSFLGFLVA